MLEICAKWRAFHKKNIRKICICFNWSKTPREQSSQGWVIISLGYVIFTLGYCDQLTKYLTRKHPSQPCESVLYCNLSFVILFTSSPSLPCEYVLYINTVVLVGSNCHIRTSRGPSLPYEIVLYINTILDWMRRDGPSLPSKNVLNSNLKQRHYRLLQNFNLFTNEVSMILIHLYFRHYCQGPWIDLI